MKKNKIITSLIVSSLLAVTLTACGKSNDTTSSSASDNQVTVRFGYWGSQERIDATTKAIELYEKENPNVKIEQEYYTGDAYTTQLNNLSAADDIWDVFQIGSNYVTYKNQIEPLDSYIKDGIIDISNTTDEYMKLTTDSEDGKVYGYSNGVNANCMVYNSELFQKAGVSEPENGWSWADFEEAATKIHEKLGIYGASGFMIGESDYIAGVTVGLEAGTYFYNPKDDTKLGVSDYNLFVPYIEMRKKLIDEGIMPDAGAAASVTDITNDYFSTEKSAIAITTSNKVVTLGNDNVKVVSIPVLKAGGKNTSTLASSQMMSIAKSSKVKEAAAKFISWFENDVEANKILNQERGISVNSNVRDALAEGASPASQSVIEYIDWVGENQDPDTLFINNPKAAEITNQYKLLVGQVYQGQKDAKTAAEEFLKFAEDTVATN